MRRFIVLAAALATLATAGLAVAAGRDDGRSVKAVAGTFSATASSVSTKTCTTPDNRTISVTNGRYTGTAAGDPDLAGSVRIDARATVDTAADVGVVEGKLRIATAASRDTFAAFSAVYDHGRIAGVAVGRAHAPYARLLANLSAGFSAAGGFTDGRLGATSGGSAVEIGPGKCEPAKTRAEKSEAKGSVTAVSSSSITVAGVTCAVPAELAQKVGAVKVGDRAEIHCSFASGANTLVKIETKR